ncbi:MAG: hypothetical protein QMD09_09120 [Desulfatibacillaceae bacterium]|nr:hypothetical protein [Desulfatibacillaceae bacterium]
MRPFVRGRQADSNGAPDENGQEPLELRPHWALFLHWTRLGAIIFLGVVLLTTLYVPEAVYGEVADWIANEPHPAIFLLAASLLPVMGFPITVVKVLAGIQYGFFGGMAALALIMPLNLAATYPVANFLLDKGSKEKLALFQGKFPFLKKDRLVWPMILLFAVPGPPHLLKNSWAALSGLDFFRYLLLGSIVHVLVSMPYVAWGMSLAEGNTRGVIALTALLAAAAFFARWFSGRRRNRL